MSTQTLKLGIALVQAAGDLRLDVYPFNSDTPIVGGEQLQLAPGTNNRTWYSAELVSNEEGWHTCVLTGSDGEELADGPFYVLLADVDGDYILRLEPPSVDELDGNDLQTLLAAINTRLAASAYVAPDNSGIGVAAAAAAAVLAQTTTTGVAISAVTRQAIASTLLTLANGVETGLTLQHCLQACMSAMACLLSGAQVGPTTMHLRNYANTKDRMVATVDADANRLTLVYDFD